MSRLKTKILSARACTVVLGTAEITEARVHVRVPADAVLAFNGVTVPRTGTEREFISPALTPGKRYGYQVKARWTQDGKPVERTLQLVVRANTTATVDFAALPALKE